MEEKPTTERLKPYERQVGNWIRGYLEYTSESESPESYHLWAGISAIASAVRRNVWIDQGIYVLFPNLFIAFIGPPARTAKSTALYLEKGIINKVPGVKMGPSACTKEQLIRAMAESKFDNQCALTIHSSEFSDLVDSSGILMIQFLTSIYDGNYVDEGGWKYETKHQGKDNIINPFLNMIFGTTPTYFAESMPESIVGHGFTSRTIIVYEEKERHQNPRPRANNAVLGKALTEDLIHIGRLRGQFQWGGDVVGKDSDGKDVTTAMETYDRYYRSLYDAVPVDHRLEGFHWRKKTHVLKVAMLLSLAERDDMLVQSKDIETAAQFLRDLEPSMARAFSAVGRNEFASVIERIGSQVRLAGEISMEDIYSRNYSAGSSYELDNVIATLEKMGAVRRKSKVIAGLPVTYLVAHNGQKQMPWMIGAKTPKKVEGEPGEPDHLKDPG
jgi:hypothetical protein